MCFYLVHFMLVRVEKTTELLRLRTTAQQLSFQAPAPQVATGA